MSIVFMDGFDHYSTAAEGLRKWGGAMSVAPTAGGRFGTGNHCRLVSNTQSLNTSFTGSASVRVGLGFNASSRFDIELYDQAAARQTEVRFNSNGTVSVTRNLSTVVATSAGVVWTQNQWTYVEVYATCKDSISLGEFQVYVNGALALNVPATSDTKNTANTTYNFFVIVGVNGATIDLDDIYIETLATTTTPTFRGDLRISTLFPNGNGNYSQMTGSDSNSTDNYALVDEPGLDDADYVEADAVGETDTYTLEDLPVGASGIVAVATNANWQKTDAGALSARQLVRISGTDYEGSSVTPPSSPSWAINQRIMETSPATAAAWDVAEVDAMEAGVKYHA